MYEPGSIVLVNFPFTDLQSSKVRPALALTTKGDDVIILGIFSKVPFQSMNLTQFQPRKAGLISSHQY
jgi:hypothetical protein